MLGASRSVLVGTTLGRAGLSNFLFQPTTTDTVFEDKSPDENTITLNTTSDTPTLSTAISDPAGGSRKLMYRTGSNSGLNVTSLVTPFDAGGVWTIQCWIYKISGTNSVIVTGVDSGNTSRLYIVWLGTTAYIGDGIQNPIAVSSSALPTSQWVHVAGQQTASNLRLFVDGTQIGSTATKLNTNTITELEVGYQSSEGGNTPESYVTGFEIVAGTALFPDDGSSFTPEFPVF